MELGPFEAVPTIHVFSNLERIFVRRGACLYQGMSFWMILFAAQIVVTAFAFFRESGRDNRFEGDKLGFRS
jgi:hypothetical protein